MISLATGQQFYYADRQKQRPVICTVLSMSFGYPTKIIAREEDTGEVFTCYRDFGCYTLNEYNKALEDAKIQSNRVIY